MFKSLCITAIVCLCFFASIKLEAQTVPAIHQRVTDLTGTLRPDEIQQLNEKLAGFEKETSNQIVVLFVPSVEGESFEEYSLRVAEKNKFGRKGRDNGVLFFITKEERKLRFEVGYGLESVLPDALCDQIIRKVIVPQFRNGNYFAGIDAGISAVMLATKGEFKGDDGQEDEGKGIGTLLVIGLIFFFLFVPLFGRIFGGGRRYYGGSRGWYSSGPWIGGGGGFGGGGGGFGGGGFSGGGGSFGGGGASGSW